MQLHVSQLCSLGVYSFTRCWKTAELLYSLLFYILRSWECALSFGSKASSSLILYPAEILLLLVKDHWESHIIHEFFLKPQHISPDV